MITWWLSNDQMTVRARTNEYLTILEAAPLVRRFIGQPIRHLGRWMNRRPGFHSQRIHDGTEKADTNH